MNEITEGTLRNLIWCGYRLVGKPKDLAREIRATRAALMARRGVPIDICLVNESVAETLPVEEGLRYVGRRYIDTGVWYLGNMASAHA